MVHSINQWKSEFLNNRCLEQVTGMPLYSYRMTLEEFVDLEKTLKERMATYLEYYSLVDISRHVSAFPSLFVIYSAEWWRRRYDGSGWSWEPILDSIGMPSEDWNQSHRSECVEKGLKDWGLKLVDSQGLRYLGSIAFQGGLPMQLLATSRGNISRVLSQVLKLASKGNFEITDVQDWIRSLSNYLPKAYRQNEIYVLLAEVVISVLRLKTEANLKSATGALAVLDAFNPHWRNTFPLPIEDSQAQGLIDQLIKDAAGVKLSRSIRKIIVERYLKVVDGVWELFSDINLPEYIDSSELKGLFKIDDTSLTRQLSISFVRGDKEVKIGLRILPGQDRYVLDKRPAESNDINVSSEHSMTLNTGNGEIYHSTIVKGDALSSVLPWLFELTDIQEVCPFSRQGPGSFSGKFVAVCIPECWSIRAEIPENIMKLDTLNLQARNIWKVSGSAIIYDENGHTFRIKCGQANINEDLLELRGERVWDIFSRPNLAFLGTPKLFNISENGLDHQASGGMGWKLPDGKVVDKPNGYIGPIDAYWPAIGDIKWYSRLALLPENAKLSIEPGDSPNIGSLRFSNWGLLGVHLNQQDIKTRMHQDGNDLVVELDYQGTGNPPEFFEISVLWPGNTNDARLNLPFPAKGVRAIDAQGIQFENKHQITISKIAGVRIVGFLGGSKRAELTISLHRASSSSALFSKRKIIKSHNDQSRIELRLIDYADEINKLLAGIDALDATVNFRLQVGTSTAHILKIAKYECELIRLISLPGVGLSHKIFEKLATDDLTKISINALRLDAPGNEPIKLKPASSETVATGNWIFPYQLLTPGPWMIYPDIESVLVFRPLIWPILEDFICLDETKSMELNLANALRVSNENDRRDLLEAVVVKLGNDFLDPDWNQVEQLAANLGHLPLSTLDLWRSFTHSSKGMVALNMRLGSLPVGFVDRFSMELPWMWETVSLEIWAESIELLLNQTNTNYGNEAGNVIFLNHVNRRTSEIPLKNPALRILIELAKAKVTNKVTPDIRFSQQSFMDKFTAERLFVVEDCLVQKLLRNNAEESWPSDFTDVVNQAKYSELSRYLCPKSYDFHDVVINIPIILALCSVLNLNLDWLDNVDSMRALRAIQDFDPDWFSEAFDLTVARCLASGLINIKKEG